MAKWRWGSWLALVLLASLSLWYNHRDSLPVETDMLALLPATDKYPAAELAWQRFSERLGQQLVFLLSGQDWERLTQAAERLSRGLESLDGVTLQRNESMGKKWYQLYEPYRFGLLSDSDQLRFQNDTPAQLWLQAQAQWLSPFAGISGAEIGRDPLLLFRHFLQEQRPQLEGWQLREGWLTRSQQGTQHILMRVSTQGSAFALSQQGLVSNIAVLEQEIREATQISIMHSGMLFYAVAGAESARSEISRIGTLSLLGIGVMVLLVFRSILPLALSLFSLLTGMLAGVSVTLMVFGKIHLLTLVFGCSLLGVAIDYTFHFLAERALEGGKWRANLAMRRLRPALLIGLISTLIAYCTLLVAPFPGLKQMAVFSCAGLTAAFLSVVCCFPEMAARPSNRAISRRVLALPVLWFAFWQHPRTGYLSMVLLGGAGLLLWPGEHYDDDIGLLQSRSPLLIAQEQQIAALTGNNGIAPMLVVSAESAEANLQRLEQLQEQLQQWRSRGIINDYQSPALFLPSLSRQQHNRDLLLATYSALAPRMAAQGLSPPEPQIRWLTPTLFFAEPITEPVSLLWQTPDSADEPYLSLVILRQLTDSSVVREWLRTQPGVYFVDRREQLSELFGRYRLRVIEALVGAGALLWFLAMVRYGPARGSRVAVVPLLACVLALALSSLLLPNLNLFNLLALLLVVGISLDFAVFSSESRRAEAVALSVTLAALTSLLSFGLLSLSSTQAVAGFGVTVAIGISVAWWLSPFACPRAGERQ